MENKALQQFGLMHAPNYPLDIDSLPWPLVASEKLDGWRCLVYEGQLFTKTLGKFANRNLHHHLREAIEISKSGVVLDGELWSPSMRLTEIQSVLQSENAIIPDHLVLYVFDGMPKNEWGLSSTPFYERQNFLSSCASKMNWNNVKLVKSFAITKSFQCKHNYERILNKNGEGLVVRNPNSPYIHRRCKKSENHIWKLKPDTVV